MNIEIVAFYAACIITAMAVALVVLTLMSNSQHTQHTFGSYSDVLKVRLAKSDSMYAFFDKTIEEIADNVEHILDKSSMTKLRHSLDVCGKAPPWSPQQYVAAKVIEGLVAGLTVGIIITIITRTPFTLIDLTLIIAICYSFYSVASLHELAAARARSVRSRMSFATDLMALILDAGGTPVESFDAVVKENANHPLGEEFGRVTSQARMGKLRSEALKEFRDRYPDPDISEFVFAILKGEELGTPLAQVLNIQSQQMRLRHSQWCEKQTAEASVKMAFPSLIVMIACILVILGPLLLPLAFATK